MGSRLGVSPSDRQNPMLTNTGFKQLDPNASRLRTNPRQDFVAPFLREFLQLACRNKPSPQDRNHSPRPNRVPEARLSKNAGHVPQNRTWRLDGLPGPTPRVEAAGKGTGRQGLPKRRTSGSAVPAEKCPARRGQRKNTGLRAEKPGRMRTQIPQQIPEPNGCGEAARHWGAGGNGWTRLIEGIGSGEDSA